MAIKRMPGDEKMRALFSKQLQALLEEREVSQAELSRILNVSESAVGKWILKKAMPRMGVIQQLADHFHIEKSYFLEDSPGGFGKDVTIAASLDDETKGLDEDGIKAVKDFIKLQKELQKIREGEK